MVVGKDTRCQEPQTSISEPTPFSDKLTKADCCSLALLHVRCLPDSLISRLGYGYAKAFYRFISNSRCEFLFVRREAGEIVSACILSLSPKTLATRLLTRTSALLRAPLRVFRLPVGGIMKSVCLRLWFRANRSMRGGSSTKESAPEVVLIFTAPEARCRGLGSTLLHRCERFLLTRGHRYYVIKTADDEANLALKFYAGKGFRQRGPLRDHGKRFQLWEKKLTHQDESR